MAPRSRDHATAISLTCRRTLNQLSGSQSLPTPERLQQERCKQLRMRGTRATQLWLPKPILQVEHAAHSFKRAIVAHLTLNNVLCADSQWRNRSDFFQGTEAITSFLTRKWEKEHDYRLRKTLWAFDEDKIAVRFEYEFHDASGQWHRAHGNEVSTCCHALHLPCLGQLDADSS